MSMSHKQYREQRRQRDQQWQQQQNQQNMNPLTALNPGCSIMVNNIGEERLLLSHLKPEMRVLEFGLGLSTQVMASMVKEVVSVEHNEKWYNEFKDQLRSNVTAVFVPPNREPSAAYSDGTFDDFQNYVTAPMKFVREQRFDVVFIDGRARRDCAKFAAWHYLKEGGLIFIHDYKHPDPQYRRPEYEVVEEYLDLKKHVFTMAVFTKKGESSPYLDIIEDNLSRSGAQVMEIPPLEEKVKALPDPSPAASILQVPPLKEADSLHIHENGIQVQAPEERPVIGDSVVTYGGPPEVQHVVDESTCWYSGQQVVDEMNRFYDNHIKNHEITRHMEPLTRLMNLIDAENDHRLLDLGCGSAMLVPFCKEFSYTGADLGHIISGCAMRNYPEYFYRTCDMVTGDLTWIKDFDVIVLNGIIDVMERPVEMLTKILALTKKYLLIHRQEITEAGETRVVKKGSYGGLTYHSIIRRELFQQVVESAGFRIVAETPCMFGDWENGGSSFLLARVK